MLNIPDAVKTLCLSDRAYKNFRITFPYGDRADITNENIVTESVALAETLCSSSEIKFGLCESPVFTCETVGVENIKGCTIDCMLEIECPQSVTGAVYRDDLEKYVYPIPYGRFVVDKCPRQSDMTHRKITAYQYSALNGFTFPTELLTALNTMEWYKEHDFSISIECLLKIIGMYSSNYELLPASASTDESSPYVAPAELTINNHSVAISVIYAQYDPRYALSRVDDGLVMVKPIYTSAYRAKLKEGAEYFQSLLRYNPFPIRHKIFKILSSISYAKNATPVTGTYGNLDVFFKSPYTDNLFNPESKAYPLPYLMKVDSASDGTSWCTYLGWAERWVYVPSPYVEYFNVPIRVYFVDLNAQEIIWDSGTFENRLAMDSDITPILTSESGLYYTPQTTKIKQEFEQTTEQSTTTVKKTVYKINAQQLASMNIKKFIQDSLEARGLFGRTERNGNITLFSLEGADEISISKNDYKSIWYDEEYTKKFGRIVCDYTSNGDDNTITYDISEDYDDNTQKTYELSNNTMIDTNNFTDAEIEDMLEAMADNIDEIEYIPAEVTMAGMPWVEVGDYLNIETENDGNIKVLVEKRNISGIQNLTDNIECQDEVMETTSIACYYDPTSEMLIIGG